MNKARKCLNPNCDNISKGNAHAISRGTYNHFLGYKKGENPKVYGFFPNLKDDNINSRKSESIIGLNSLSCYHGFCTGKNSCDGKLFELIDNNELILIEDNVLPKKDMQSIINYNFILYFIQYYRQLSYLKEYFSILEQKKESNIPIPDRYIKFITKEEIPSYYKEYNKKEETGRKILFKINRLFKNYGIPNSENISKMITDSDPHIHEVLSRINLIYKELDGFFCAGIPLVTYSSDTKDLNKKVGFLTESFVGIFPDKRNFYTLDYFTLIQNVLVIKNRGEQVNKEKYMSIVFASEQVNSLEIKELSCIISEFFNLMNKDKSLFVYNLIGYFRVHSLLYFESGDSMTEKRKFVESQIELFKNKELDPSINYYESKIIENMKLGEIEVNKLDSIDYLNELFLVFRFPHYNKTHSIQVATSTVKSLFFSNLDYRNP